MTLTKARKTKGISAALGVALSQGAEGLIFVVLGLFFLFNIYSSPSFVIATLSIKEVLTLLFTIVLVKPRKALELLKKMFVSRKYKLYLIAGVFGTTFGNLFFLMAFQLAGAEYGGILTAIYPVFSFLLIRLFRKEKDNRFVWLGVVIAVLGAIGFTVIPTLVSNTSSEFTPIKLLGICFGMVAALFWAIEGLIIHIASEIKDVNEKTGDAVLVRSFGTTFTSTIVLLPAFAVLSTFTKVYNPLIIVGDIFTDWGPIFVIIGISLNLVILRYMHIYAISQLGPKLTAIIDTNNFLVAPFFSIFLANLSYTFSNGEPLYSSVYWWLWFLIIPILVGVFIVLYFHKEKRTDETYLDHIGD